MCKRNLKTLSGAVALSFSAGVVLAYLLPGFVVAFVEAALLIGVGLVLLQK